MMTPEEIEEWRQIRTQGRSRFVAGSVRRQGVMFAVFMMAVEGVAVLSGGESRYDLWQLPFIVIGTACFFGGLVGFSEWSSSEAEFAKCERIEATKPVEPTGISSFPSDLTTSHTSGDPPGGSLRR